MIVIKFIKKLSGGKMKKISLFLLLIVSQSIGLFSNEQDAKGWERADENGKTVTVYTAQELTDAIQCAADNLRFSTKIIISGEIDGNFEVPLTQHKIKLVGNGSGATLNGGAAGTTLVIDYGATVILENLTITNGNQPESPTDTVFDIGGGIFNEGKLTINCCLINNCAPGGILNIGGILEINDSSIDNNIGQGIASELGVVTINESTICGNSIMSSDYFDYESGISTAGDFFTINRCHVDNNNSTGITCEYGILNINESYINSNIDGGIVNFEGVLNINDSEIKDNLEGGIGNAGVMTIYRCRVRGNTSTEDGGGIYNELFMTIIESTIEHNSSELDGGGIYNDSDLYDLDYLSQIVIKDSIIKHNTSNGSGGGIYNLGSTTLIRSEVADNTAEVNGGGIDNEDTGYLSLLRTTVKYNTATTGNGGGIYNTGEMVLNRSNVEDNEPDEFGQ